MSSSDSDDDCYGNIAQKLQTIKSKYEEEVPKVECSVLNSIPEESGCGETKSNVNENTSVSAVEDLNVTLNSTDNDELTLDAIIANNSKQKRSRGRGRGRGSKRKSSDETPEPSERVTRNSRRKTTNSTRGRTSPATDPVPDVASEVTLEENPTTSVRSNSTRSRGRGRNRGRSRSNTASPRGRRRWGWNRQAHIVDMFTSFMSNYNYPTYSVGNTDEYPDQCDSQQLFAAKPVSNDIEIIETDPLEEENEEMSVKVYWQNIEIFKFKIRKYQKLTQIFDYFAEKEKVSYDKLFFTYNDKILKIDDTPDSIAYSIAKFIDGGIVNQNVTELVKEDGKNEVNKGLKIKFQCQNVKKPFQTSLRPEDKMALAMMKCAEHLETPLERLKFYFDGDLITSKTTPQDLELEGGECIDVKITS